MRTQELLEAHKHVLDAYLHQHKLSWELIGIGWATNVGLLTILLTVFSQESTPISLGTSIMLFIISSATNLFWWLALARREIYKESFASKGEGIERELNQLGVNINVFRIRKMVREEKRHPVKKRRLHFYETFASTAPSRYSFILMIIFWAISISLLSL